MTLLKKLPVRKCVPVLLSLVLILVLILGSCELYSYGILGGADKTNTLTPNDGSDFSDVMTAMSGVWYSHYAGMGRLDGYRIGKWADFKDLVEAPGKTAIFPHLVTTPAYETCTGESFGDDDFFVFYDDTVYGQSDDGVGGNGGWDGLVTRYIGIVRAVNLFYGDKKRGAVIIEYLKGAAPQWDDDIKNGQRPFFGMYYRVLGSDTVQMANAVDLAALYAGKKYYTEKAKLTDAIEFNSVENEAELISWGVVIPQNREPR